MRNMIAYRGPSVNFTLGSLRLGVGMNKEERACKRAARD
jgi:hypothetical protein